MLSILSDKYRPRRLSQVLGQDKAIARLRQQGNYGGRAYFISGKSGTGKTTIARCLAATVADKWMTEEVDAGSLTPKGVAEMERQFSLFGWGKGGRAWIINEAHGLHRDTLRALLVLLEPGNIPAHVVVIFTTTVDGMSLFEDGHEDAGPLLSRCVSVALTSQGLAAVFARFVSRIASREGLNGRPLADYVKLANREKGNCRAMLSAVQAGEMRVQG